MDRRTSRGHSTEVAFGANTAFVSSELQMELKKGTSGVSSGCSVETGYRAGGLMVSVMRLETTITA